jgi:hypothetical protein
MKALTLTQPWASLVAIGAKSIETRSWSTSYRGPLAIHAAKGWSADDREFCYRLDVFPLLYNGGIRPTSEHGLSDMLPRGVIVAIANLHRVGRINERSNYPEPGSEIYVAGRDLPIEGDELAFGNYDDGRYGWVLTNVRRLAEPVLCRGHLGLWDVPADVEQAIHAQLHVAANAQT